MKYKDLYIEIPQTDKFMIDCCDMLAGYSGPRRIALDLGAHIGTRSLWLATDGRFEHVWSIECAIDSVILLCKNINMNNLSRTITPVLAAVDAGQRVAYVRDHTGYNTGQRSICFRAEAGNRLNAIITTPLSALIDSIGAKVDFIKIDIEGTEYSLFSNSNYRKTKRALSKTECLFIETHGPNEDFFNKEWFMEMKYNPGKPNEQLIKNVKKCGFKNIEITDIGQIIAMR